MACLSCKVVVKEALEEVKAKPLKIELGEAEVKDEMSIEQKKSFNNKIKKQV